MSSTLTKFPAQDRRTGISNAAESAGSGTAPRTQTSSQPVWLTDGATALFLDAIFDHIPAAIFVKDARDLRFLLVNKAAEAQMCCKREEMIGRTNAELLPADEAALFDIVDREVLRSGQTHVGEGVYCTADKGERLMHTRTIAMNENGQPRYLIGISEDITERRANELRIAHLAHHDSLTDLPNRVALMDRLGDALAAQRRHGRLVAVLCIDLDHFKDVNDSLGHAAGDTLLKEVAERLLGCVRAEDFVSRQGGDEFTVLQPRINSPEEARRLAERIVEVLARPFSIEGQEIATGGSIGIAIAPQDGITADVILRHADTALYRAKADGRSTARFFEAEMDARLQARRCLERDLRLAFAEGTLELFYQPLLRADEKQITGFEALLRWRHPERGFVSPSEFIPLAEDIGLIVPVTEWVLETACAEAMTWPEDVRIAVNLSPAHFRKRNPALAVAKALMKSGLAPQRLEVEITESLLLHDSDANIAILHQIRDMGVRIAMDDFGTGYSSLSYLRSFPFDKIKIDRTFVQELGDSPQCSAIVQAVTGLGVSLGITTTAEGVETPEQLESLVRAGCSELQGFLFSRPVPAEEARALLIESVSERMTA